MEMKRSDIRKNDLNYLHVAGGWGGEGQVIIKAKPISTTGKTTTTTTTTSTSTSTTTFTTRTSTTTTTTTTSTSSPGKLIRSKTSLILHKLLVHKSFHLDHRSEDSPQKR